MNAANTRRRVGNGNAAAATGRHSSAGTRGRRLARRRRPRTMPPSVLLALLAAVILGADLTVSDAEILQESTTQAPSGANASDLEASMQPITPNTPAKTTAMEAEESSTNFVAAPGRSNFTPVAVTVAVPATNTTTTDTPETSSVPVVLVTASASNESRSIIPTSPTATEEAVLPDPPSSDSLTKGFSIPTFLPDFPAFPARPPAKEADLLQQQQQQQQQDQLYLAAYNKHHAPRRNLSLQDTNVTVQMGSHAYMPCHIRRLMNKPVSWVRVRDGHILTVDQTTFIADQRFQSIFKGENEYTWSLQIKYVQDFDEGWYECQVSTEPKMSAKVYLSVVVPKTELIGDQNRFVKAGSKVALHCIVRGTLEPPSYIIWFRGQTQVTDDNKMGWYTQIDRNIFGNSGDQQNTIGSLIIPFVRKKDSGNYTCQPSNSASVSVDLHVLSGEYSASAIMSAGASFQPSAGFPLLLLLLAALQKT